MRALDLTQRTFGRLTVLYRDGHAGKKISWRCRCACGALVRVTAAHLTVGHTLSCGCLQREEAQRIGSLPKTRHGEAGKTPEYSSWRNMLGRCYNEKHQSYEDYGGRGIAVDTRWRGRDGYESFLADMGRRPGPGYSLERKKNELGYSKENCVWATRLEQNSNTRRNVYLTSGAETYTLAEWARRLGLSPTGLRYRLKNYPTSWMSSPGAAA